MKKIPETIELNISPMRIITGILTLVAFGGLFFTSGSWISKAEGSHALVNVHEEKDLPGLTETTKNNEDNIVDLSKISEQLANQQKILIDQQRLEREMWGDDYEKRIFEILSDQPIRGP